MGQVTRSDDVDAHVDMEVPFVASTHLTTPPPELTHRPATSPSTAARAATAEAAPIVTTGPGRRGGGRLRPTLARHAYAAAALPLTVAALGAVVVARGGAVAGRRRALALQLLTPGAADEPRSPGPGSPNPSADQPGRVRRAPSAARSTGRRIFVRSLVSLPVDLLAFALVTGFWAVFLARGVLYPVFGANNLEDSWGGPSLAGAWIVHFIQGPPLFVVVSLVLVPISRVQARLAAPPGPTAVL